MSYLNILPFLPLLFLVQMLLSSLCAARTIIAAGGTLGNDDGLLPNMPLPYENEQRLAMMLLAQAEAQQLDGYEYKENNSSSKIAEGKKKEILDKLKPQQQQMTKTKQEQKIITDETNAVIDSKNDKVEVNEKERAKRRDDFYSKVQNVHIQDEQAIQLYQHWADQAFSNLLAVIANQKLKQFEKPIHTEFGDCSKRAKTVPMQAKCLSDLINGKIDGEKYYKEAEIKTARFEKYRMKKRMEFRKKMAQKEQQIKQQNGMNSKEAKNWIGGLRMLTAPAHNVVASRAPIYDQNQDISASAAASYSLSKTNQFGLEIGRYGLNRRLRRQTGIVKKNYYELLSSDFSAGRLSPMGRIAETLMKKVLKAKGKQEDQIVP